MKKIVKSIILTIFPLIAVIAIDQYSKNWALSIESPKYFWELKFNLIYNQGIVLGHLTHLPARVKEISLVTMGAFVVTFYLLAIWLLPIRSRACFLGLSILVGGIIGNVLDRFNGHGVIDFISLNLNFINFPYMNLADIFQWVG